MHKIKIIHLTDGLQKGGAEAVLASFVQELHEFEHHIYSLTDEAYYSEFLRNEKHKVLCLNLKKYPWRIFRLFNPCLTLIKESKSGPIFFVNWMYNSCFLACMFYWVVRFFSKANNIKWCWCLFHALDWLKGEKRKTRILIKFLKIFSKFPHKIIFVSEWAKRTHLHFGFSKYNAISTGLGVDCQKFIPNREARIKIREKLNIPIDVPLVAFFGRYHKIKNVETFVKTANVLLQSGADYRFILVGDGCDNGSVKLTSLVENNFLQKKILFLGEQKNVIPWMQASDIAVNCSFSEAFPYVIIEALACGCLCIAPKVCAEALANPFNFDFIINTGQYNDVDVLMEKIKQVIAIPVAKKGQLKAIFRQKIEKAYSKKGMIDKYRKLMQSIQYEAN